MEANVNVVGIIRAIDDLGRVVIPKEIRRSIGLHENDKVDILTTGNGDIILRKVVDNKPVNDLPTEIEKRIFTFRNVDSDFQATIKITREQDKLFDWLISNEFLREDVEIIPGYPEVEDLT
jgi:AbrB family looped-hinge helix DNA binding protein